MTNVVYVRDELHLGDSAFAWSMAPRCRLVDRVDHPCPARGRRARRRGAPTDERLRYHRWARRILLAGGMMLGVALLSGFMVPRLGVLLLLWALNGAGQALIGIPLLGLLAEDTQPEERGRAYAAHFALTHLFCFFTYPAAGYLAREIGTPRPFTVGGVFCLILTLAAAAIRMDTGATRSWTAE